MVLHLLIGVLLLQQSVAVIPPATKPEGENCTPIQEIVESVFLKAMISYFVDNPRGTQKFHPESVKPLTAANLFEKYYGKGSSPFKFNKAILQIVHSDPGIHREGPISEGDEVLAFQDLVQLREKIYTLAKANSFDLARENFGLLLFDSLRFYAGQFWMDHRCFEDILLNDVEHVINTDVQRLRNEIGEFAFANFMAVGSGTSLTFVIDTTGSMSGEIEAAKQRTITIINERQGSLDQPQDFVLVAFNDPKVDPPIITKDAEVFKRAIGKLRANGGGDAPELAMRGIQLGVESSQPGSTIYVITDVDAKDAELQDNVVAQAKEKNIKIVFLLTNTVRNNVCRSFSFIRRPSARCSMPIKFGMELYEYIADATGGKVLVVGKRNIFKSTEVVDTSIRQGIVQLAITTFEVSPIPIWEPIPPEFDVAFSGSGDGLPLTDCYNQMGDNRMVVNIDSGLKEVFVEATGGCDDIVVNKPDGAVVELKNNIKVGTFAEASFLTNEEYGEYIISSDVSASTCEIKVSARSTRGIIQTLARMVGEEGARDLVKYTGQQPLVSDDVSLVIDTFGDMAHVTVTRIEIVDVKTGQVLQTQSFEATSGSDVTSYRMRLTPQPGKILSAVVRGIDENGVGFQRVDDTVIEFVNVKIDCSDIDATVFRAGDKPTVKIPIINLGESSADFAMGVSDDQGFVKSINPTRLRISGMDSGAVTLLLEAPKTAKIGTTSLITITAKDQLNSNAPLIFKQCRIVIGQKAQPTIESFNISTNINSRFAETSVKSTVLNDADISRNAIFHVIMPLDSFITEFSMTIDGVKYPGKIEEKEQAEKIIAAAKEKGVSAGHVAAREESTTTFTTDVNLEPRKRVTFELKYQQLLRKVKGSYRHETNIQTKQPVGSLSIDVFICETRQITSLIAQGFDTEQTSLAGPQSVEGVVIENNGMTGHVSFKPTKEQQLRFSPLGLSGKFIIEYNVEEFANPGKKSQIVSDGAFFAHEISFDEEVMPKRVVFLLDISGSMFGSKITQLRSAMRRILNGLNPADEYGILVFNSNVSAWLPDPSIPDNLLGVVNEEEIINANMFLNSVVPTGATNIGEAITQGIKVLEDTTGVISADQTEFDPISNYLLFLTDGRPTEGIMNANDLVTRIDEVNRQRFGIHTIGFGNLVDMPTLAKIAARNKGTSKQIFEDIDADIQIADFFDGIAHPMLRDVEVSYDEEQVQKTSLPSFDVVYSGNEVIISGQFQEIFLENTFNRRRRRDIMIKSIDFVVNGKGKKSRPFFWEENVEIVDPYTQCPNAERQIAQFTKRLSVFMELKNKLQKMKAELNTTVAATIKEEILNSSLANGFVVPGITSMIVLKPDDLKQIQEQLAAQAEKEAEEKALLDKAREDLEEELRSEAAAGDSAPSTATRPRPTLSTRPTLRPLTTTRRAVVLGDPHFIVDIDPQITLCFNWVEESGQIFNLLHDSATGLSVNARLISLNSHDHHRTFIDQLSINAPKRKMNILMYPDHMEFNIRDKKRGSIKYDKEQNLKRFGVDLDIQVIYSHKSRIVLKIDDHVVFSVVATTYNNGNPLNVDHLDFAIIDEEGLNSTLDGVFGIFKNFERHQDPVSIEFGVEGNSGILWFNHRAYTVGHEHIRDYTEDYVINCWAVKDKDHLLMHDRTRFKVDKITQLPKYTNKTKRNNKISMENINPRK